MRGFSLQDGVARLDSLSGEAFGGRIEARGTAQAFHRTLRGMLKSPVIDVELAGKQIDLATLIGGGLIRGRLDVLARAQGPMDAWTATVKLPPGAELVVLGERWRLQGIDVLADARAAYLDGADGPAGPTRGGRGRGAAGVMDLRGPMAWEVTSRDVPLAGPARPDAKRGWRSAACCRCACRCRARPSARWPAASCACGA